MAGWTFSRVVWSWWAYEPSMSQELVFVASLGRHGDVQATCQRLGLPLPEASTRLHPAEPGFAEAAQHPDQLLWMRLDDFARRSSHWLHEDQLLAARSRQRLTHAAPGRR